MNPVKSEDGFGVDNHVSYASNIVSVRIIHGQQDKTGDVDAYATLGSVCHQLLGEVPAYLYFEQNRLNLDQNIGQLADSCKGSSLVLVGARIFRVTLSVGKISHNITAYNDYTFGNLRESFNALLTLNQQDYLIDRECEVVNQDVGIRIDDNTPIFHVYNTVPALTSMREYEEEIVYSPLQFDIQIRLNGSLFSTSVHKYLTTRELADEIANKYHLNTEFYIDVDKGARVAIDRNTMLLNLGIVDGKRHNILNISLQAGEVAQRLRYLCLSCGDSVFRAQTDSVECRNCGSVILLKTRPQNVVTQYVAR